MRTETIIAWIRLITCLVLVLFMAVRIARAQNHEPYVPATYSSGNIDVKQDAQIFALDQRVSHIEAAHVDVVSERVNELTKRFDTSQSIQWAILIGVIVQFLTSGPRLPWMRKRDNGR